MWQFDVNNVLSDLKKLSDETDIIIHESLKENDQIECMFDIIKETVDKILKGTYVNPKTSKTSLGKIVLPSVAELVKRKQPKNQPRVSVLLAQNQKDHIQHTNRNSRNSLRRIILKKKSSKNGEIRKSGSEEGNPLSYSTTPPNSCINEKNTESEFKTPLETLGTSINKSHNKANDISTPLNNDLEASDAIQTPLTRSRKEFLQDATQLVKSQNKEVKLNGTYQKTPINSHLINDATTQIIKKTKKLENCSDISEPVTTSTPLNETILLDSSESEQKIKTCKTPLKHHKRKSSLQLTQENGKRLKSKTCEKTSKEEIKVDYNSLKKSKTANNVSLQAKTSNILSQHNSIQSEKRVLREIQKKEDTVTQNAKKIKSLRQLKIEENKKNREIKMEKAMQQRMKIEKEKEDRLRCRTHSKQEIALQKEVISKKPLKKAHLQEDKVNTPKKKTPTSAESLKNKKEESKSNKRAPPKPVRTPAKKTNSKQIDSGNYNFSNTEKYEIQTTFKPEKYEIQTTFKPEKALLSAASTKAAAVNATFVCTPPSKAEQYTSTPAVKKLKTGDTKTPISSEKPSSYAITPHQSSFVSYDISEIKSDDSDEEEETNQKPIPSWASSVRLRTAVLTQYYHPLDTDELFGNYFETPDLASIMGVQNKKYYKRTSSAVWAHSPNRSILA